MISIVCSPMGTLTDEQISDLEKVSDFARDLADKMFATTPPKMHAALGKNSHMLEDVNRFRGMKEFVEDFIEKDHQYGNRDKFRLSAVQGNEKKAKVMQQMEEGREHLGVQSVIDDAVKSTSKKTKNDDSDNKEKFIMSETEKRRRFLLENTQFVYKYGSINEIIIC
jgi:hypothetical protein